MIFHDFRQLPDFDLLNMGGPALGIDLMFCMYIITNIHVCHIDNILSCVLSSLYER